MNEWQDINRDQAENPPATMRSEGGALLSKPEPDECAADDAVAFLRYWKSMMHPAAWVCWTPETCDEARVDGEAGSCPTCLVDAFLAGRSVGGVLATDDEDE